MKREYTYKSTLNACFTGSFTQAIINNLTPLLFIIFRNQFNISYEMIGRLILINFATQMIVDVIALKFADRLGYRRMLFIAHVFATLGLISLGILPNIMPDAYWGLVLSVIIYAIGGGCIEVLVSPLTEALPGEKKKSTMSLLHSFYCWGQVAVVLVSTITLRLIGESLWFILPVAWTIIPVYNCYKFLRVPLPPPIPEEKKVSLKELFTKKIFIVALVLMISSGASEICMSQWSSLFAETGLGVSKVMGDILGPCLFAVLMGLGRVSYALWGSRFSIRKILIYSSVLCILCYLVTSLVQIPIISLLGCALCGLSISIMWPGMLSYTAEKYPTGGTAMFGMLAVAGDIGCSFGPWMTGIFSDAAQNSETIVNIGLSYGLTAEQTGLKTGLLAAVIFPVIMIMGLIILKSKKKIKRM